MWGWPKAVPSAIQGLILLLAGFCLVLPQNLPCFGQVSSKEPVGE